MDGSRHCYKQFLQGQSGCLEHLISFGMHSNNCIHNIEQAPGLPNNDKTESDLSTIVHAEGSTNTPLEGCTCTYTFTIFIHT